MQMKKRYLLGLACLSLHAATSLGQQPTLPPAPLPTIVQEGPTSAPPEIPDSPFAQRDTACPPRMWASTEFLLWWTKKAPVNTPLLTNALDPNDPTSGAIGSANTSVIFGGQSYDLNTRYGGRFTIGGWLDSAGIIGLEGSYLFISPKSITRTASSDGGPTSPVLAFPFFDPNLGQETSLQFVVPGNLAGTSYLQIRNQLQAAEINFVATLVRTDKLNLTGLAGFRYVNFKESLDFQQGNAGIPGGFAQGQQFSSLDSFRASNNFYGGQFGLRGDYCLGNFFIEGTAKVALGTMNQAMDINGTTNAVFPDGSMLVNATGGTFAQSTNIGHHTHNAFCAVPEGDLKVGYNLTRSIQAFVSYNYLYLSNVARPGVGIDHNVNPTQAPFQGGNPGTLVGPTVPAFSFQRSDFWAQGVSFGLQFKF
jgi:Putative beta barrel porin-7 (BBP7)